MDWLKAIVGLIQILRAWLDRRQSAEDRAAGAAQAKSDGLEQQAKSEGDAAEAIAAAHDSHAKDTTDGAFKNTEFRD